MQPLDLLNQNAPDFELPDQDGKTHKLSDYLGKWVVLYFYPADDTPGCTTEACSFRDNFEELVKEGVSILGVSKDTVTSHKKFHDKYGLNFTLLADPEHKVIEKYDSWGEKEFMGKQSLPSKEGKNSKGTIRNTFLINTEGVIVKIYQKVKPEDHALSILEDLKTFQNES